jgi:trehalose-6-phosphatase
MTHRLFFAVSVCLSLSPGFANCSDVLPVYIGDDRTDEDAFKVLSLSSADAESLFDFDCVLYIFVGLSARAS